MTAPFNIIPPNPWVDKMGNPTQSFFQFISNLFAVIAPIAIPSKTILANITAGSNFPVANSLTAILDASIGNVRGDLLSRGVATWGALTIGPAGQAIVSNGTDPIYALVTQLGLLVQFGATLANASVPANFSASKILEIKDGTGTVYYVPVSPTTW